MQMMIVQRWQQRGAGRIDDRAIARGDTRIAMRHDVADQPVGEDHVDAAGRVDADVGVEDRIDHVRGSHSTCCQC